MLSSTASNYNTFYLYSGVALAVTATAMSFAVAKAFLQLPTSSNSIYYVIMLIAYSFMMFASSYVEEEQHFWYWIASGWILLQHAVL